MLKKTLATFLLITALKVLGCEEQAIDALTPATSISTLVTQGYFPKLKKGEAFLHLDQEDDSKALGHGLYPLVVTTACTTIKNELDGNADLPQKQQPNNKKLAEYVNQPNIKSAIIREDRGIMATVDEGGEIELWRLDDGSLVQTFYAKPKTIADVFSGGPLIRDFGKKSQPGNRLPEQLRLNETNCQFSYVLRAQSSSLKPLLRVVGFAFDAVPEEKFYTLLAPDGTLIQDKFELPDNLLDPEYLYKMKAIKDELSDL